MRNDADHAATGISCANIRKAMSGMLLKASCVRACERVWVHTRVPNWHVLLPAELAWAALGVRAALGDWTGASRGAVLRACAVLQWCFPDSSAAPYVLFTCLPGQGYPGQEGRLLSAPSGTAPPWRGTGGSPCCTPVLAGCAHGCSTCMDSPTSEKPHCTCGIILQLALKKHWKSSSKS